MIRLLLFLLLVFALGVGFAWLAERPGDIVATFGGYRYEVSLMVAAVVVVVVVAVVMLVWWLLRAIWHSPYAVARYFRVRRRDRGYQALSTGMIAAGSGDGGLARRMGRQAGKLIDADREPLIHLLDAQAALLEGDHEAARTRFEAMLDDPELRLLGLRGLYLEAMRLDDRDAARHYAGRAADMAPQLTWAVDSTLEARAAVGDWDGALKLIEAQKATRQADREAAARQRAVLLTARAMTLMDSDPAAARAASVEANRLRPDFVPAALAAAKAHLRNGDLRRGTKILEAVWRKEPHPEVADAHVHARPGDSGLDRLARARKLRNLRPNNVESELAVARAALDAGEYGEARAAAEAAMRIEPREAAYLLLADIEEVESGDQGRVRQWLARALRAPRDPAWVADGHVAERWSPVSPVTGRLDAFEWRVPHERLGAIVEGEAGQEQGAARHPSLAGPAEPVDEPPEDETPADAVTVAEADLPPAVPEAESIPTEPSQVDGREPDPPRQAAGMPDATPTRETAGESGDSDGDDDGRRASVQTPPVREEPADGQGGERRGDSGGDGAAESERPPPPDDPGVEEEEGDEASRRFRLF